MPVTDHCVLPLHAPLPVREAQRLLGSFTGGGPGANERGQLVKAASRKVEEFRWAELAGCRCWYQAGVS